MIHTKLWNLFKKGTHNKCCKYLVASDKCKISKALPNAMGLWVLLRKGYSKAGRNCWVSGKGEGTEVNDQRRKWWQPETQSVFQWKWESHLAEINLSSRKELGDVDKQMGLKPINLLTRKQKNYGSFSQQTVENS